MRFSALNLEKNGAKIFAIAPTPNWSDRCPRCYQPKPCQHASLHDDRTGVCSDCFDSELAEQAGVLAGWTGHVYWKSADDPVPLRRSA